MLNIKAIINAGVCAYPVIYNHSAWLSNKILRRIVKILLAPFVLARYFHYRDMLGREGLAFVLIAKNEAPYIKEWIDFHRKQGASHFIIYDNESTDNFREVLEPYIEAGLVTYSFIPGKARQADAYNMALHDYGHKFKYFAIIDADEFVFVRSSTGGGVGSLYSFVDEFMTSHSEAGGIGVNWCIFGSNGHITKPEGGVLENYTRRSEDDFPTNKHIKTICDPMKVLAVHHVHYPFYRRGFQNLDENGRTVTGPFTETVSFSKIRINHYFGKSREEYIAKKNRGRADIASIRPISDFDALDRNDVEDTEILSHR